MLHSALHFRCLYSIICWMMYQPFWLPSFTLCGPDPSPGFFGKAHKVHTAWSRTPSKLCGCRLDSTYTLCGRQRNYSVYRSTRAWCYWSALLLSVYSSPCSLPPSLSPHALVNMYSEAACIWMYALIIVIQQGSFIHLARWPFGSHAVLPGNPQACIRTVIQIQCFLPWWWHNNGEIQRPLGWPTTRSLRAIP